MANPSSLAVKNSGNPKVANLFVTADLASTDLNVGYFVMPITITRVTYTPNTAGTTTVGTIAVNAGVAGATAAVCTAKAYSSQAALTPLDIPITSAANAILPVGSVVNVAWVKTSGTIPSGMITVEYFNHDV